MAATRRWPLGPWSRFMSGVPLRALGSQKVNTQNRLGFEDPTKQGTTPVGPSQPWFTNMRRKTRRQRGPTPPVANDRGASSTGPHRFSLQCQVGLHAHSLCSSLPVELADGQVASSSSPSNGQVVRPLNCRERTWSWKTLVRIAPLVRTDSVLSPPPPALLDQSIRSSFPTGCSASLSPWQSIFGATIHLSASISDMYRISTARPAGY